MKNEINLPVAAYGQIVRGDETTSEDQVAVACSPSQAERIAECLNFFIGIPTEDIGNDDFLLLTKTEANLLIQWFNAVQDLNSKYLKDDDYILAEKIIESLDMQVPNSISEKTKKHD